ncbi:hypothetical protein FE393_15500 [Xenorhabdus sp. psl]|nr:hypothetical protein [Xenorhabdus sp. psl]
MPDSNKKDYHYHPKEFRGRGAPYTKNTANQGDNSQKKSRIGIFLGGFLAGVVFSILFAIKEPPLANWVIRQVYRWLW